MKHEALIELVKSYGRSMGCVYTAQYRGETDLGEHFEREAAATLEQISDELAKRQVQLTQIQKGAILDSESKDGVIVSTVGFQVKYCPNPDKPPCDCPRCSTSSPLTDYSEVDIGVGMQRFDEEWTCPKCGPFVFVQTDASSRAVFANDPPTERTDP